MDKEAQIRYFEGLLAEHGPNYLALDWNSVESQRLRYKVLKEILVYGKKAANISIADVGCGLGDLYGFFKADGTLRRNGIKYFGYDISPALIAAAKKKYPDAHFECRDIVADRYFPGADYFFCSGVFNIRTTDRQSHLDYVKEMLARLYDLCSYGVAVNFLSAGSLPNALLPEAEAERYFYFDPAEVLNYVRFLTGRYLIRHDYHPGDFSVYLLKK